MKKFKVGVVDCVMKHFNTNITCHHEHKQEKSLSLNLQWHTEPLEHKQDFGLFQVKQWFHPLFPETRSSFEAEHRSYVRPALELCSSCSSSEGRQDPEDNSYTPTAVAWLGHVAVVKLEACWCNTRKNEIGINSDSCAITWRSQIAACLSHDPSLVDSGWPSSPSVLYILSAACTQREWK